MRGRPRRSLAKAREFGRLVERERQPREKLEAAFLRVRRRDPQKWGSLPTMWRLWHDYRAEPKPRWKLEHWLDEYERVTRGMPDWIPWGD